MARQPFARAALICAAALCAVNAAAREALPYRLVGATLTVRNGDVTVELTALSAEAIEVHYRRDDLIVQPSFALIEGLGSDDPEVATDGDELLFAAGELTARIAENPFSISFWRKGKRLTGEESGFFAFETLRGFRFTLDDDEKLMGGGQRVLGMDRRGHRLPLDNKPHYGYETESTQMYYSVPAILSSNRYLLLFDNPARGHMDLGASYPGVLQFEAPAGRTAYVVVAGDTYPEIVENYTAVTGRQPLPPRWALGNFASRFGYRSEEQTRDTVRRFREADIPLDAIVLDLYWFGADIFNHMGNLDWDRDNFPTPEKMMADFEADGIKTILITEPFVLSTSKRWRSALDNDALAKHPGGGVRRFDFYFGNTGLLDVFDPAAADWYWQIHARHMDDGVAGWWGDLGEPEVHPSDTIHVNGTADEIHNAYGHAWAKLFYDFMLEREPETRPFIMMRAGFAGTQRYGIVPWTGDVSRTWGGLKPQVELGLTMSLLGLGYIHSDLGGFAGGEKFDRELYLRWLQYGVFQPIYRPHAQEHIPSEPVYHDRRTREISREFIRLRYRLLPYLYTLAYENATRGMPLMRPLFFDDDTDPALIEVTDAYLFGDAFLVSPVTDPGVRRQTFTAPDGRWFDFFTGEAYDGGRPVTVPVTERTIPVLVRAGSFVPMVEPVATTRDYASDELELHYWDDPSVMSAVGQMYEDDGASATALSRGAFELLRFSASRDDDRLTIALNRSGGDYPGRPDERQVELIVHNADPAAARVAVGDTILAVANQEPAAGEQGAWREGRSDDLTVRLRWDHAPLTLRIE